VPEPGGDTDNPPTQLQFNPEILFPSDPQCGSTATTPCVFDGTKKVSSGFVANFPTGGDFYVKLDPALLQGGASTVVNYVCLIHPEMAGSVTLVADKSELETSEVDDVRDRAFDQFERDTRDALQVERRDTRTVVNLNKHDKTHTLNAIAGTATQYVEVSEMLPRTLAIKQGDTVNWVTKTIQDPHTVTFPKGSGSNAVDPLLPVCEGAIETTLAALNPFLCGNPSLFEIHFEPQPQGPTSIASASTVATSGIIANGPGAPNHFAFSFPNAGTFEYQCRIHDHMIGTVTVKN
jgi:plastocyanin